MWPGVEPEFQWKCPAVPAQSLPFSSRHRSCLSPLLTVVFWAVAEFCCVSGGWFWPSPGSWLLAWSGDTRPSKCTVRTSTSRPGPFQLWRPLSSSSWGWWTLTTWQGSATLAASSRRRWSALWWLRWLRTCWLVTGPFSVLRFLSLICDPQWGSSVQV